MTRQLKAWEGEFGEAYTERAQRDWRERVHAFRHMFEGLEVRRILEVGCNRGHNLTSLAEILGNEVELAGIEPNRHALEIARASGANAGFMYGHSYDIPFKDGYFDLAFTAGVLIHISLADLPTAMAEIYRVSSRYVLAIEYFAEEETVIDYRGHDDLLWKRDFLKHYQEQFPDLKLVRNGYWGREDGFDRTHWWLLKKPVAMKKSEDS